MDAHYIAGKRYGPDACLRGGKFHTIWQDLYARNICEAVPSLNSKQGCSIDNEACKNNDF